MYMADMFRSGGVFVKDFADREELNAFVDRGEFEMIDVYEIHRHGRAYFLTYVTHSKRRTSRHVLPYWSIVTTTGATYDFVSPFMLYQFVQFLDENWRNGRISYNADGRIVITYDVDQFVSYFSQITS